MSTALVDALTAAAESAGADFERDDPDAVIRPAARVIRRYRAGFATAATLGSAAVIAGVAWGAESFGTPLPEAAQSPGNTPTALDASANNPWSTADLAAVTQPRKFGERRIDSAPGMICRHEDPQDDPRVANRAQTEPLGPEITNCVPVWFKNGPITSDRNATAGITLASADEPAALSTSAVIGNLSDKPIAIDGDSVFMWIETKPDAPGAPPPVAYANTLIGTSMWSYAADNSALLGSTELAASIVPGQYFVASAVAQYLYGPIPQTVTLAPDTTGGTVAVDAAAAIERVSNGEPERYTTPAPSNSISIAPPARLANYVVAHSEYSSPMTRRMALLGLVASDGTGLPAEDAAPAAPRSEAGSQDNAH